MHRIKLVVLSAMLAAAMSITTTIPVSAQEEEPGQVDGQWYWHPNSGNYWYCAYFPGTAHLWGASASEYWCYTDWGQWIGVFEQESLPRDGWQPA